MKAKLEWFEINLTDLPKLEKLNWGLTLGELLGSSPAKAGQQTSAGIVPAGKVWLFSHKTSQMLRLLIEHKIDYAATSKIVTI